jgi:hypothetical protein
MRIEMALEVAGKARLHPPVARDNHGRFMAGHSVPGPGRPVGSRARLCAQLVDDLLAEWHRSGRVAIKRLARENPRAYLQLMGRVAKQPPRKVGD